MHFSFIFSSPELKDVAQVIIWTFFLFIRSRLILSFIIRHCCSVERCGPWASCFSFITFLSTTLTNLSVIDVDYIRVSIVLSHFFWITIFKVTLSTDIFIFFLKYFPYYVLWVISSRVWLFGNNLSMFLMFW